MPDSEPVIPFGESPLTYGSCTTVTPEENNQGEESLIDNPRMHEEEEACIDFADNNTVDAENDNETFDFMLENPADNEILENPTDDKNLETSDIHSENIEDDNSSAMLDSEKTIEKSAKEKIIDSINDNIKGKKYVVGEYQCDNWVQEVLTDAGFNYNDYFAGEAKDKTCEEHIKALKEGTYTTTAPTEEGVYVVLMNDGHKYTKKDGTEGTLAAHTGILVIGDGNPYFYDNSSGNNNGTGGVEITKEGTTASSVMDLFGYDSFYYQKIN